MAGSQEFETLALVPLSFAQRRMWLLTQLPESARAYNMPLLLEIEGAVSVAALRRAFAALIERHAALRTRLVRSTQGESDLPELDRLLPLFGDFEVLQGVAPVGEDPPLPVEDLAGAADPAAAARARARELTHAPFDLEAGPLYRARLLRLAECHHVLVLVLSHLVADGWSIAVLCDDLGRLYRGAPLAAAAAAYTAHAVRQRGEYMAEREVLLAYWRERLAGLQRLALPTDRPRPVRQTYVGDRVTFDLEPELMAGVHTTAALCGGTPFMVLLAAFQSLLGAVAGQDDVVVGAPIANREHPDVEATVGLFVNNLVVRIDVGADPTFRELVARTVEVVIGALEHRAMPFEELVAELRPERDAARSPLFQVLFNFLTEPQAPLELDGCEVNEFATELGTAKLDLTLGVRPVEDRCAAVLEFNTDLFDRATIERLAADYRATLRAAVADPDLPRSALPAPTALRTPAATHPATAPAAAPPPRAPQSENERYLVDLFAELLGLSEVSVHDNFFDLGGHSLLAMRAAMRIERDLGVHVMPMELLMNGLSQCADLCDRRRSGAPQAAEAAPTQSPMPSQAPMTRTVERSPEASSGQPLCGHRETAVLVGPDRNLVGVLCEPVDAQAALGIGVVLLNAGATPRLGPQRLYVKIARQLAERGFTSLRLDYSGLGDSPVQASSDSYEQRAVREADAAFAFLAEARGIDCWVPMGMCWGADNAFRACCLDPRIQGAVMVDFHARPSGKYLRRLYAKRLLSLRSWRSLLGGQSAVLRYIREAVEARFARRSAVATAEVEDNTPFRAPELIVTDLEALAARGADLCFVYANGAPSYDHYRDRFRSTMAAHPDRITVEFLENADHLFTVPNNQRLLIGRIVAWMEGFARRQGRLASAENPTR